MAKKTTTERLIDEQPGCTYCAGRAASKNRDHAPPITIFNLRDRPKGLEFGVCAECHEGTRAMDLIASVVSRFFPNSKKDEHRAELQALMRQFVRRFPILAAEFKDAKPVAKNGEIVGYAIKIASGGITSVMEAFAARMGLALYREISGTVLPASGGAAVRWFSNVDAMQGKMPGELIRIMGPDTTLKTGTKEVSEQFTYQYAATEHRSVVAVFVTFRFSFAFAAFMRTDATEFGEMDKHIFRPGFLKGWKPPEGRGPALRLLCSAIPAEMRGN